MSKEEKPKQSRRKKEKYPALKKKFNLKRRSEFIESEEYVNGVVDKDGRRVIRALTDEEKDFLNKFNEETINANFVHNPELRKKRKELKKVQEKLALINPNYTKQIQELHKIERKLEKEVKKLRDEHLIYSNPEDHKEFYNLDYGNKMCIMSNSKAAGMLDEHTEETYNKAYEKLAEYKDELQVNEYHEKDMIDRDIDDY